VFIYTLLNTDDSPNLATYQDAFLMLRSTLSANYINKKIPLKLENSHSKPCKYYKKNKHCVLDMRHLFTRNLKLIIPLQYRVCHMMTIDSRWENSP